MKKYLVGLGLLLSGFALTACGTAEKWTNSRKGTTTGDCNFLSNV